jgi:hypothetical protein
VSIAAFFRERYILFPRQITKEQSKDTGMALVVILLCTQPSE